MPYQCGANTPGLIVVDQREGGLGLAGLNDDVAAAADQGRAPVFIRDRDQSDVLDEVDVKEKVGLFLGNLAFDCKVAMVECFRACARKRRTPPIEVLRTLGADRDRAPVTQRSVVGCGYATDPTRLSADGFRIGSK